LRGQAVDLRQERINLLAVKSCASKPNHPQSVRLTSAMGKHRLRPSLRCDLAPSV
jgi:hypothetical protein